MVKFAQPSPGAELGSAVFNNSSVFQIIQLTFNGSEHPKYQVTPFLVETEKHRSVLLYPVHSGVKCQTWLGICLTISGMGQIEPYLCLLGIK